MMARHRWKKLSERKSKCEHCYCLRWEIGYKNMPTDSVVGAYGATGQTVYVLKENENGTT
jgi:hypothetical protein